MGAVRGCSPRLTCSGSAGRLLLVFMVALGMLQAAQPLHHHRAATAGVYNEQHVLDAVESIGGDVPLAGPPAALPGDAVAGECPTAAGARWSAPFSRHADSRAPPLA